MLTLTIRATRAAALAAANAQRWARALRDAEREHAIAPSWETGRHVRHCAQQLARAETRRRVAQSVLGMEA
jgi:hypothetical protein